MGFIERLEYLMKKNGIKKQSGTVEGFRDPLYHRGRIL